MTFRSFALVLITFALIITGTANAQTVGDVINMQRENRTNATYDSMVELRDAAAQAVTGQYARYRANFRLGTVSWNDNHHEPHDGAPVVESANITVNLDTGVVKMHLYTYGGYLLPTGKPAMEAKQPGIQWIGDEDMVPESFPNLSAAWDWLVGNAMASNGALPSQ